MLYYWVYHITLFFGANPTVSQVSDSCPNPNPAAFWRLFPVHCFGEPASAKEGYQRSTSLIGKAEFSIWSSIQKNLRLTLLASMTFPVTGYSSTYALVINHGWLIKSLLNGSFCSLGESLKKNWLISSKAVVWWPEGLRQHQPNIDPEDSFLGSWGEQIQLLRRFQRCFGPGQHARSWGCRGIDRMVV